MLLLRGLEQILDHRRQFLRIREAKRENMNGRGAGNGLIERINDLGHPPDIGFGGRQEQGVGAFIGAHLGVGAEQRLQVGRQLGSVGVTNRDDLCHHLVGLGNLPSVSSLFDGNIPFLSFFPTHDRQRSAIANRRVPVLVEDCVQQVDRFLLVQRLIAPHVDFCFHFGLQNDDEPGGVAQIVQDHFQRHPPKVQAQVLVGPWRFGCRQLFCGLPGWFLLGGIRRLR